MGTHRRVPVLLLTSLAALLLRDGCSGQRMVQIQDGPLFRVKGYPISISCNVTGFKGPEQQDFQFSIYKPNRPEMEITIISTADSHASYAMYSRRVQNGEIEIQRLTGSSVLLRFKTLLAEDVGKIECFTPNTDGTYLGTYNAKTTLNVIEDTLVASYSGPDTHSLTEGDPLQLECLVSSQTFQHTHLSVTWLLHGNGEVEPRPIIALDRDLTVKPGAGFEDRYRSGRVSMHKVEDTIYRLRLDGVQESDTGRIYCHAMEWIQDPDRSWVSISYKEASFTNVTVKAPVVSDTGSFVAHAEVANGDPQEGKALGIRCRVEAQNLPGRFFSVSWLKDDKEVAQIGPAGVRTVAQVYQGRESEGELRALKMGEKDFLLTIQPVRAEDQGQYQCKVWQEDWSETGEFKRGKHEMSDLKVVKITPKESSLVVAMAMKELAVTEGDVLQITCLVSGAQGPLSVVWQHKKASGTIFSDIITLSLDGVMSSAGAQYQQRSVRSFRSTTENITLEVSEVVESDTGEYRCTVSEWNVDTKGDMKRVDSKSDQSSVKVDTVDSLLKVSLSSREVNKVEGCTIQMTCAVKGTRVPVSVIWRFQTNATEDQRDIVRVLHTGETYWEGKQLNYQLSTEDKGDRAVHFHLWVLKASSREAGLYECQVKAFQQQIQKAEKFSNRLGVTVQRPGSMLSLSVSPSPVTEIVSLTEATMNCSVLNQTSNLAQFAVTWLLGDQKLVSMDREGVVTLTANPDMLKRVNLRVERRWSFQLTIEEASSQDSGRYQCQVEEWLQDPHGDWYPLLAKSVSTELIVTEIQANLLVRKENRSQSLTDQQQEFQVDCSIDSRSHDRSVFEVTWFRSSGAEEGGEAEPIFTVQRDSTLRGGGQSGGLSLGHPEPKLYTLSVPRANVSNRTLYYCEVVEWMLLPSNPRELARDRSGELTIYITASRDRAAACSSGMYLGILLPLVVLLLLVLIALLFKMHKMKTASTAKKKADALWATNGSELTSPEPTSAALIGME